MKNVALAFAGIVWFGLVFLLTFWMTFPSDSLGERLKYEVYAGSDGDYQLQLQDVSPWWVGLSGEMVQLYSVSTPRGGGDPETELIFAAEAARVRVSLFSLLGRAPAVSGGMTIGGGDVDFSLATQMDKKDRLGLSDLQITAEEFPIIDLASVAGASMEGSGTIDIDIDISAPDGMKQAEGKIQISGSDILITKIDPAMTGGMDLGMEIPLENIDIDLDITQGKAEFSKGRIQSSMANVELDGYLQLRDDLTRSTADIAVVFELGDELAMFKSFLNDAKGTDGKFHYKCTGSLARVPRCAALSQVSDRRGSTSRPSPRGSTTNRATPRDKTSAEDREKRREEIRERLRQRREGTEGSSAERPSSRSRDDDRRRDAHEDDEDYEGDDDDFEGDDDDFEGDDGSFEDEEEFD